MRGIALSIAALVIAGTAVHAMAQAPAGAGAWATKPVRWLVGFAPGASNDIVARVIAARLTESLNQQVIVDNRTGASGIIAAEIVTRATPDGHTVLLSTGGPNVFGPLLTRRAPYRVEDFTQVITIGYTPFLVVAHPAFPPRGPRELVDYLKANPGKINWGSSGIGGSPHFGLLVLQAATGIEVNHVPYKGSAPALIDMVAGHIQAMHTSAVSAEAHLNARRLKAIAVAAAKRLTALPDVATFVEQGIANTESSVWFGMAAPPATPRAIVMRLNTEVNRILQQAESIRRLQDLGLEIVGGTPDDATQFVKREAAMLTRLIQQGRIKPE